MASIPLDWTEIKSYCDTYGPGKQRPAQPRSCPQCDQDRIWYNGWRWVFPVFLQDGQCWRFDDGLALQRVKCAHCEHSWTLRPAWLCPQRQFQLDVVEWESAVYVQTPTASYRKVAEGCGCSASSVWRWVGWCAAVAKPAEIVAQTARIDASTPAADMIPRHVPAVRRKARSASRAAVLLLCLQVLVALGCWSRALAHPASDPSPLRSYVSDRFLRFRIISPLTRPPSSPRLEQHARGPPV